MHKIKLGDRAKDKMTGFAGIVVAETQWLHGCRRLTIQPEKLKDGKVVESMTFDEPQLQLVKTNAFNGSHDTGGPRPEPQRHNAPR